MSVFVTVGSTSFDELIEKVCSPEILHLLAKEGFKKIILQVGKGNEVITESNDIEIEWFRFKDSITNNIKNSDLVIGHSGAGTILQSLIEHKPLIAVLNEKLMDNHQSELAEQLAKEGVLRYCTCSKLLKTLENHFSSEHLLPYTTSHNKFSDVLQRIMGYK